LARTEPGGHRWQRVPPNEKRGRVHTSTVTVAVFEERAAVTASLQMRDVVIETYRGSGPGGQHRNKTESCARAIHVPTGIEAKSESERSQHQNKQYALASLAARVARHARDQRAAAQASARREQVGTGQRGDKVRTIRVQDGVVTCERTGRKSRLKEYLRGELEWLG
jgi:peptide chain release factor 1